MKTFLIGALGYPALELLWRGRTHPSRALAGGVSAVAFRHINRKCWPLIAKALAGGAAVTLTEAACGLMWNRRHRIWDYRRMPCNWRGQVCLPYSLLWCGLAAAWMIITGPASGRQKPQPHCRQLQSRRA